VRACAAAAVSEARRAEAARYLRRAAELALPPAAPGGPPPRGGLGSARGSSSGGVAAAGAAAAAAAAGPGGVELLVSAPGLSPELARFLVSHRGDAYSAVALKWYGNELMRGGFPDQVRRGRAAPPRRAPATPRPPEGPPNHPPTHQKGR
jgi:hypothetical protein